MFIGVYSSENEPGSFSCVFVIIRTIWYLRQIGLIFVLEKYINPAAGSLREPLEALIFLPEG